MGKTWMAEGHDTFVEHLYLPGWELRRKKRAEESSEDADTSKRVRYNSESEDDRLAQDRRTLQEREKEDRDLNESKHASEAQIVDVLPTVNVVVIGQDSHKYDNKKGGGQGSCFNRSRGSSQRRFDKGSKSQATVDSVYAHVPASDIVYAIQSPIALPALSVVLPIPVQTDLVPPTSTDPINYLSCNIFAVQRKDTQEAAIGQSKQGEGDALLDKGGFPGNSMSRVSVYNSDKC